MKNPFISVIVPTYNRADKLSRAIGSVLNQDYKHIEIILVDDASTDNTPKVMAKLRQKHPNLFYHRLTKNSGEVTARNYGIQKARGELITFLDSDDELTPESIASRVKLYYESKLTTPLVYGDFLINGELRQFKHKSGNQYSYLLKELSLCGIVAVLLHKQSLLSAGLPDKSLPSWGDDDLILSYARYHPIIHLNKVVANIYTSQDSVSINQSKNLEGCQMMIEKYKLDIKKHHGNFGLMMWKARVIRIKVLVYKQKLLQSHSINSVPVIVIRSFMWVYDKILLMWFDNLFV